jgi:hypothetical protein
MQRFGTESKRSRDLPFYLLDRLRGEVIEISSKKPKNRPRFVALSYVWGQMQSTYRPCVTHLPFSLSERCSKIIEDAITVVLGLEFRDLWVDFLCISPDASRKHDQIANMDLVYQHADLTIVAASGENDAHGLPGVGQRPRLNRAPLKIKQDSYVVATAEPDRFIHATAYRTCAWTLQEFSFSRGILVFTDDQVYYQCQGICSSIDNQESSGCPPDWRLENTNVFNSWEMRGIHGVLS